MTGDDKVDTVTSKTTLSFEMKVTVTLLKHGEKSLWKL